uniref:Saposin A-type domain-containing protein n=1 Tax=Ursus maritimus TaxID=29073 RepID=A0A452UB44_URSMA
MPSGHLVGHRFSMAGCVCLSRDTVGSRTCGPARAAICMKLEQVPRCQSFARRVAATWSHTAARCGNVAGVSSRSGALSRLQGHHTATDPYLAGREPSTGRQAPLARNDTAENQEMPRTGAPPPPKRGRGKKRLHPES